MLFKNQYYCFVAGLPEFSFDSMKLPFTVEEFISMLREELKPSDLKLLRKYFLIHDNNNLLNLLGNKDAIINIAGKLSREEIMDLITDVKEDIPIKNKHVPPYFEDFIRRWLSEENPQEGGRIWEDLLTSFYMDYGIEAKNSLLSGWFELNLNIGNLMTAVFARKYDLMVAKYIVGHNTFAKLIRENSNARDFGISQELVYFDTLIRISEESDIFDRERKIDKFKWDWLEENTVFDYFNIEYIFAYFCKLQILERWVKLNAEEGEKVFRDLINSLKNETKLPDDF
jgi:polyhydroxyalkanoate synthesis regulator phasin